MTDTIDNVQVLLVTCSLEETRNEAFKHVATNLLSDVVPLLGNKFTVFDNASTIADTVKLLSSFPTTYRANKNVGYWSAISWWLDHVVKDEAYVYVIESDMIHYAFNKMHICVEFLDAHSEFSAVRLHRWSHAERHRYNKDAPTRDSDKNCWQSHTNRVTGKPITFYETEKSSLYGSNFLTQLPALNRSIGMKAAFELLKKQSQFYEPDFQRFYFEYFAPNSDIAILDGGMFQHDLGCYSARIITGSYTSREQLKNVGYCGTRIANIVPENEYTVILT